MLSPSLLSPGRSPRAPSHSTGGAGARTDAYTPLLSTIHMRHAMMKQRIETRWKEVDTLLEHIERQKALNEKLGRYSGGTQASPPMTAGRQSTAETINSARQQLAVAATTAVGHLQPQSQTAAAATAAAAQPAPAAASQREEEHKSEIQPFRIDDGDYGSDNGNDSDMDDDDDSSLADDLPAELTDTSYENLISDWQSMRFKPLFDSQHPALALTPTTTANNTNNITAPSNMADDTASHAAQSSNGTNTNVPTTAAPLTPRHAYSVHLAQTLKNLVALLMQLDKTAMASIRSCFVHNPNGLCLYDFLLIAQTYMRNCVGSAADIAALIEMFRDIDVNGDGVMEWDEFTSHLVQLASTYGVDSTPNQLPHFTPAIIEDTSGHDRVCDHIQYLPAMKRMILFERNSRRFKVYGIDMKAQRVVRGHRSPLIAACYWEKGEMLVTSSADKTLCFWSHANNTFAMDVSWSLPASYVTLKYAGGHTMFAADTNNVIIQWHLERAEERCVYRGHTDVVMDIIVLPHYNLLASCSLDTTVRLWDVSSGIEVSMMKGHTKSCLVLAYHTELKLLISAGLDRFALVWNPRVLSPVYTIQCASPLAHIVGLEVLPGSPELVIGDSRGCFIVYDLRSFSSIQQFSIPSITIDQSLHSFTMIHSHGLLVAAGAKLHAFKRTTGVRRHAADDNAVRFAAFNPNRLTFITVASDNIKVWNALTGQLEREEKNFTTSSITAVCLDDLQKRIYIGCHDGSIYCLNYSSGAIMTKLHSHRSEVSAMIYQTKNKSLLSGSWDATVAYQDDKLSAVYKKSTAHTEDVLHIAVSESLSLIATAGADCCVYLHDETLGPVQIRWTLEHLPSALCFLDPYPLLLVADHSGGLTLLDCSVPYTRSPLMTFPAASKCSNNSNSLPVQRALNIETKELATIQEKLRHSLSSLTSIMKDFQSLQAMEAFLPAAPASQSRTCAVMSMTFVSETGRLYTADDAGYVKRWDLTNNVLSVFHPPTQPQSQSQPQVRHHRTGSVSAQPAATRAVTPATGTTSAAAVNESGVMAILRRSSITDAAIPAEALSAPRTPEQLNYSEQVKRWSASDSYHVQATLFPELIIHAHEDSCCGLSFIADTLPYPTLLTWSFDGTVFIWDSDRGLTLGSLQQGNNSRHEGDSLGIDWKFNYDLELHRQRELELMREELKPPTTSTNANTGSNSAAPSWLREEDDINDDMIIGSSINDTTSAKAAVDKRMMTPIRLRRQQEKERRRQLKAPNTDDSGSGGGLPAINNRPRSVHDRLATNATPVHLEHLPPLHAAHIHHSHSNDTHHGVRPTTGSRLWVADKYLELTPEQTQAAEHLSQVIHRTFSASLPYRHDSAIIGDSVREGEEKEESMPPVPRGQTAKQKFGEAASNREFALQYGHWAEPNGSMSSESGGLS